MMLDDDGWWMMMDDGWWRMMISLNRGTYIPVLFAKKSSRCEEYMFEWQLIQLTYHLQSKVGKMPKFQGICCGNNLHQNGFYIFVSGEWSLWGMISVSLTTHFTIHSMEINIPPSREAIKLDDRHKAYVICRFQQGNMSLPFGWIHPVKNAAEWRC